MALNRYRLISFDRQMGIGVAGAMQVTVSAVAKTNTPSAPYCVPNELVCSELGRFLRLPVPPCGLMLDQQDRTKPWFASMDFNLTGNSLPPVDPRKCMADMPEESTGLLLFDVLVGNCDRHRGNFAVDYSINPPRMSVFDHSHALFGYETGKAKDRLERLRDRLGVSGGSQTGVNRHCLLDAITTDEYFSRWYERIEALPDFLIDGLCRDTTEVGASAEEAEEATKFLKHRRGSIRAIIKNNQNEFRRMTWSLFQ